MSRFWEGKRVLVTGHTGFKGGWLVFWLRHLGAEVYGYSLPAPTTPSFYELLGLSRMMAGEYLGDIRDRTALSRFVSAQQFDVVFHLAAQPLVLASYDDPHETHETNILGTLNILEEARSARLKTGVIIVATSDKVYLNNELGKRFSEDMPLGGADPYSASKAAAEIVSQSYIKAFFREPETLMCSTVRAGNVFGGGDFAPNRIVPDLYRSIENNKPVEIRNPDAVRPWQHVLDPLSGYMTLAERLSKKREKQLQGGWNFGPADHGHVPVKELVEEFFGRWRKPGMNIEKNRSSARSEAQHLSLDISKASSQLGWHPRLGLESAVQWTVEWYKALNETPDALVSLSLHQLEAFMKMGTNNHGRPEV
ncbi:MAG: CDP-glucose 4,6-dehydratase [Nitratireductor sp.]